MSVLAKAPTRRATGLLDALGQRPSFSWLRRPEIGRTMVHGRAGRVGTPFNLGEMTVTRCALTSDSGADGHANIQGQRRDTARAGALIGATMQTGKAATLRTALLESLVEELARAKPARNCNRYGDVRQFTPGLAA